MTKISNLIKGQSKFLLFLISDIIPFLVNLLVFAILLRKANPVVYGQYIFTVGLIAWIFSFITFGMNYTGVNLIRENPNSIGYVVIKIIQLRLILLVISITLLSILFWLSVFQLEIFFLLSVYALLQVFTIDFVNVALEKPNNNSFARFFTGILMLISVSWLIDNTSSVSDVFLLVTSSFFSGLVLLYLLSRSDLSKMQIPLQPISVRKIFKIGIPVSLAQFCQAGYLNMDVIILGLLSNNSVLIGQYGAFSRLLLTGLIPMSSLLNSFSSRIATAFLTKDALKVSYEIKKMQKVSNFIGILGFIVMLLFSKMALEILSGKSNDIQPVVILLFSSVYIFYALQLPFFSTLPYLQKNTEFFQISLIALFISIIFSLLGYFVFSSTFVVIGVLAYAAYLAYSSKLIYLNTVKILE